MEPTSKDPTSNTEKAKLGRLGIDLLGSAYRDAGRELADAGALSASDLAERLEADPAGALGILKDLEDRGVVRKVASEPPSTDPHEVLYEFVP